MIAQRSSCEGTRGHLWTDAIGEGWALWIGSYSAQPNDGMALTQPDKWKIENILKFLRDLSEISQISVAAVETEYEHVRYLELY